MNPEQSQKCNASCVATHRKDSITIDWCNKSFGCGRYKIDEPAQVMDPEYYAGVDPLKTGDELITAERDRQVNELGHVIARDLAINGNEELEQVAILLLRPQLATYALTIPPHWNKAYVERLLCKPVQVRRVIAGALICAQIDVDNLKYQILINKQKQTHGALIGEKPCAKQCDKSNFPEGTCDCYNMGLIK